MEFVEGETLQDLIKHSGRLEIRLALEIVMQVAAGLAAVHKQELVHRDIKPSNIMVSVDEGSGVVAKIIDLGLAKTTSEASSQTAISTSGGFAGTPEFASPEQFAGVGVDIRSDLYSLGVTLWEMVIGRTPFRGSPPEVMYQHQHVPCNLRLPCRFISRSAARNLHPADSARECFLCCERPWSQRSVAIGSGSFLRTRKLGVAGGNWRWGA